MHRVTKRALCAFTILATAACQSPPPQGKSPAPAATNEIPSLPVAELDTCQAASHSALLGSNHKQAPAALAGKAYRVVCTTCPMTMDFNPGRLNIIYDEKSGLIRRLTCG